MTTDPRDAWAVEPHPLPAAELDPEYRAEPYTDPWNSIAERIANASPETLRALTNWGTGDLYPTWRDTEIGGE